MDAPSDAFVRKARLLKVVDGDTLRLEIDLGFGTRLAHDIRLLGVDTPEPRGKESAAGKWVTFQVEKFIGDHKDLLIHSQVFSLGKFGRCLCRVWVDGRCLNNWLIDSQLCWPTDSSGKIIGPRDLSRLTLPASVLRKCHGVAA